MEQQISNFVMNHPHSGYLLDFNVGCKATMCEMMAKTAVEHEKKWSELTNEMFKQAWWDFTGVSSSGTTLKDKQQYINVRIFQRKPS